MEVIFAVPGSTWFLIGCFRNSKTKMVFEILMTWENEFVKIFTLFPEIHAPRTVALHHAKALQLNSYPYFS